MDGRKRILAEAPCKLNLHLRAGRRRKDGYHEIESVFQLISVYDSLSVEETGAPGSCTVVCPDMPLPPDNTVARAVSAFRKKTGAGAGVEIRLQKRIPAGAGLGGGSSDAAAVLRALDRLFDTRLSARELADLALETGSDCPFFLDGRPALVSGRGEVIRPLASPARHSGILIWPGVFSGTKEAYRLLDASRAAGEPEEEAAFPLAEEYLRPPSAWRFFNSFTGPVGRAHPEIPAALEDLRRQGADFCGMTGSGSAVFGIFSAEDAEARAFAVLAAKWKCSFRFFFLAFSPALA